MMGSPTKEWGEPPSLGLIFFQTSTQEVPQTEPVNKNMRKGNAIIIHVGDNILAASAEAGNNKNWCLIDDQSTCNTFIYGKYLSNIRYSTDGQYLRVHFNAGVTPINKIGDLPGYSNLIWYKTKGISNILSLGLVNKIPL